MGPIWDMCHNLRGWKSKCLDKVKSKIFRDVFNHLVECWIFGTVLGWIFRDVFKQSGTEFTVLFSGSPE